MTIEFSIRSLACRAALVPVLGLSLMTSGSFATANVDKFNITPAEHAACDGDATRLCLATYPDEDKLLACMRSNAGQLTPVCLVTLKAGMKRRHMAE